MLTLQIFLFVSLYICARLAATRQQFRRKNTDACLPALSFSKLDSEKNLPDHHFKTAIKKTTVNIRRNERNYAFLLAAPKF